MTNFAENVGWLIFLTCAAAAAGSLVKGLLKLVWDESTEGNVVDTTDALFAMASIVLGWLQLLKSRWLATVCTVAVFLLMLGSTSVSVYASLGYSVMAFAVIGLLTPMLTRRLKSLAKTSTSQTSQSEQSSDS